MCQVLICAIKKNKAERGSGGERERIILYRWLWIALLSSAGPGNMCWVGTVLSMLEKKTKGNNVAAAEGELRNEGRKVGEPGLGRSCKAMAILIKGLWLLHSQSQVQGNIYGREGKRRVRGFWQMCKNSDRVVFTILLTVKDVYYTERNGHCYHKYDLNCQ